MEVNVLEVKKAKRGDAVAFAGLYQQVYADLYRFALYTLKNKTDAEDAVSETVVDAFATIGRLRDANAFKGWIFRILYNKCKDKLREYTKKDAELPEDYREVPVEEKVEEGAVMRALFFELGEEDRMIISMHLFAGYTSKEIAKLLGLNENTVRSKESRALKKLARELEPEN
ncbi:MAG: RNA polymerase sigma factor [Roseburia sp.]|nr:RNA polymerase sigma factor [Roseburia sp.]